MRGHQGSTYLKEANMQNTGYRELVDALVFAQGDRACEEAKRQQLLNERTGNRKLAENWAWVVDHVPNCTLTTLDRAA
jgi:hypothetical protein